MESVEREPADPGDHDASSPSSAPVAAAPAVSRLPLIAMGALVVLAVVIAIGLGLRGPSSFPAGTPEAAVQDYLQAVIDGDDDAVLDLVVADKVASCRDELADYSSYGMSGVGFELDELEVTGDSARAELTQRATSSGDPFEGTRRFGGAFVELRRENGDWKVEAASWPWRLENCLRAQ